ncbi:MAG: TolC family protein, partial [Acidobacteriota bacterium]
SARCGSPPILSLLASRAPSPRLGRVLGGLRLELEGRRAESLRSTRDAVRGRYLSGFSAAADWQASTAELEASEAEIERLREAIRRSDRGLSVLLGDLGLEPADVPRTLPAVDIAPLAAVPAEVLAARPDVDAALARLRAEGAAVRVARKALLPSFRITADISQGAATPGDLLKGDPVWTLLGSLAAPLLNRRALRAELDASRWRAQRAAVAYRGVLLDAVVEVEDALGAEVAFSRRLPRLEASRRHAELSYRSFDRRFSRGLADILDLLTAQRVAFDAESRLLEARVERLQNRIDLALALGLEFQ